MNAQRPTIRLRAHADITDTQLHEVLCGIEEEGIPVDVSRHAEANPLALAHEASLESRLGIGVGVALDYVVVTTEKLPLERPYLVTTLNTARSNDRAIGANAARIVKRMPLAPLHAQ